MAATALAFSHPSRSFVGRGFSLQLFDLYCFFVGRALARQGFWFGVIRFLTA